MATENQTTLERLARAYCKAMEIDPDKDAYLNSEGSRGPLWQAQFIQSQAKAFIAMMLAWEATAADQ